MGPTTETSALLSNPRLSPEARAAIRERVEVVHAKFRESHGGQSPEQFGLLCCQITQIPAAAFTPPAPSGGWSVEANAYVEPTGASFAVLWAPVQLPSGVLIIFLDLYYYDADATNDIAARLYALAGGGPFSGGPSMTQLAAAASSGSPGYAYDSSSPFQYTVNNNVAYDPAAAQLMVHVSVPVLPAPNLRFKAVDIWWIRQISPAPSVASFADVPTNHFFFQFIEALYASRITQGCDLGPPLIYCPDANVTRAEMAAFFARAFGLYWQY